MLTYADVTQRQSDKEAPPESLVAEQVEHEVFNGSQSPPGQRQRLVAAAAAGKLPGAAEVEEEEAVGGGGAEGGSESGGGGGRGVVVEAALPATGVYSVYSLSWYNRTDTERQ